MQFILPRRPDAIFATKRSCRKQTRKKLERLVKLLHTTRSWSFRLDPDPQSQHTLEGWTDTDWAGCKETRQRAACGVIVWAGVVLSSYSRTLTKEMGLSSPETGYFGIRSVGAEVRELLALQVCDTRRRVQLKVKEGHAPSEYRAWQDQPCRRWHEVLEGR